MVQELVTIDVTLVGPAEVCARLLRSMEPVRGAGGSVEPRFTLDDWIPMPALLKASVDHPVETISVAAQGVLAAAGAQSLDDWRLRNWGSQSDALDPEILVRDSGTRVTIIFGSPDCVPAKALQALAYTFPDLSVTAMVYCPSWPRSQKMVFGPAAEIAQAQVSA